MPSLSLPNNFDFLFAEDRISLKYVGIDLQHFIKQLFKRQPQYADRLSPTLYSTTRTIP